MNIGVDLFGARRRYFGFAPSGIAGAEEGRAAQVGGFDDVEIDDVQVTETHQCQIFDHLVTQGAGTHDQGFGLRDLLPLPPGDEIEGAQAVGV